MQFRNLSICVVFAMLFVAVMPANAQQTTYVVQPGDTLSEIAGQFGTTAAAISASNNLNNASAIFAGQLLVIPGTTVANPSPSRTYVVQRGDTLGSIATNFNTTTQAILQSNNLPNNQLLPGQVLTLPPVGGPVNNPTPPLAARTYVVQPGDTLGTIAARFNTTVAALVNANTILNANQIFAGQVLILPAQGGPVNNPPPPPAARTYVVQPGDTLSRVAQRFGVDLYDLARANRLLNLNQVNNGQVLVIP